MTTQDRAPAGWYADPAREHESRFWDGSGWTERVADRLPEATRGGPGPAEPQPPPQHASDALLLGAAQPTAELPADTAGDRPPHQPTGGRRRAQHPRRRRAMWSAAAASAVLLLVAAVLVWSPWQQHGPAAPTGVSVTTVTASSATVAWQPPQSTVDSYVVQRDGTDIATLPATATSYTDRRLIPGGTYKYQVSAIADGHRGSKSRGASVTTAAPTPSALRGSSPAPGVIALVWKAPAAAPRPDEYTVVRDGTSIATVAGTVTTYRDTGRKQLTTYRYEVYAVWSGHRSSAPAEIAVEASPPPLASARLEGTWMVGTKVVSTTGSGGDITTGMAFQDLWTFTPQCSTGPCAVAARVVLGEDQFEPHPFQMTLARAGATYSGSTVSHMTHCSDGRSVDIQDTERLTITVTKGGTSSDAWLATAFTGVLEVVSPYVSTGDGYCPASSIRFAVSATH